VNIVKKVCLVGAFSVAAQGLFAADFSLSVGAGAEAGAALNAAYAISKEEFSEDISDWQWEESLANIGMFIFFDATYFELSVGISGFQTRNSLVTYTHKEDSQDTKEKINLRNSFGAFLNFDVLAKYPIAIGRRFTVAPALGLNYNLFVSEHGYHDGVASDYNSFGINTGAVADFNFYIPIYLRLELLVGYQFPTTRVRDIADKYTQDGANTTLWESPIFFTLNAKIKFAVGYRFAGVTTAKKKEKKPEQLQQENQVLQTKLQTEQ
jgi:hypothetical protein